MSSHDKSVRGHRSVLVTAAAVAVVCCLSMCGVALCDEVHPDGTFINRGGIAIPLTALRFVDAGWKKGRDQGFALALQRGTNYFYLWAAKPNSGGLHGRPLCDGHLTDAAGNKVSVDDLRAFGTADFEGNGSTYLVALASAGTALLAWKLDGCEGKDIISSLAKPQPVGGKEVPSGYQRLIAGDFAATGMDGIELIADDPAQLSQWRFTAGKFEPVRSNRLLVSADSQKAVTGIRYVTTTRLGHDTGNITYETATAILHDRGYTLYRDATPIYYAPTCSEAPGNCLNRVLLFNLDQGFAGGLQDIARKDAAQAKQVLSRMIAAIRSFEGTFKVWALINPIQQDRSATLLILDGLAGAGIPFVLDFYSSDVTNLAEIKKNWLDYSPRAFDPLKGVSLAVEGDATQPDNLDYFVQQYGRNFAGVRLMERLGMDIQAGDDSFPQMISDRALAKKELSFDWDLASQLMNWSKKNRRYVVWADPALYIPYECYWKADQVARAVARRDSYIKKEREFVQQDPFIIPMYDNNEGLKRCGVPKNASQVTPRNFRLATWEAIPRSVARVKSGSDLLTGRDGFGISVQSWTTDNDPLLSAGTLPSEEITIWILDALQKRTGMVELEPYFYFFDWPKDTVLQQSVPISPGKNIGDPRDTLLEVLRDVVGRK